MVYQVGAELWSLDVESGVHHVIPITLASDFDQLRDKWITDPMEDLTSAHLHPQGTAVALTSRGRLFVAPVRQPAAIGCTGGTRRIQCRSINTGLPAAHDRETRAKPHLSGRPFQ